MGDRPLDVLEAQLEALIEGAFARLFQRHVNARDLSVLIMRAIEDQATAGRDVDEKPVAPDSFTIHLHPETRERLLRVYPDLGLRLARHVIELTHRSGYRLNNEPTVFVAGDKEVALHLFRVSAQHGQIDRADTKDMYPVSAMAPASDDLPSLQIVGAAGSIALEKPVTSIGRDENNDIVVDDAFVSRHHLQLRLEDGAHRLLDVDSRGGTFVNNVPVQRYDLQDGDVIRIGHTELVYSRQGKRADQDGTTQILVAE